jgi:hypothetical protein
MKQSHPPGNYTTVPLTENEFTYYIDRVAGGFQSEPGKSNIVELHLSGLTGRASNLDLQKFRIIDFCLFVWGICYNGSLKFSCYYLQYVPASKPFDHAWILNSTSHNTLPYLIRKPVISRQVSFVEFSTNLLEGPNRSGCVLLYAFSLHIPLRNRL